MRFVDYSGLRRVAAMWLMVSSAALVASCGGGGGSTPPAPGPTPVPAPAPAPPAVGTLMKLNDTGVGPNQCFAEGSNTLAACNSPAAQALSLQQDGATGRDAEPANNSAADGASGFSFATAPGGCVSDQVTGLMWEAKTADGGLRDWRLGYTNFGDARTGDASAFVSAVNALGLCGFSDWRLPTVEELHTIVHYGAQEGLSSSLTAQGPWIDRAWFPHTGGPLYWVSDRRADPFDPRGYWVAFNDRPGFFFVQTGHRFESYAVRLVRAGGSAVPVRYTISTDQQEVSDAQTGLTWRRCPEGMTALGNTCTRDAVLLTHEEAFKRAAAQATVTAKQWRLPNVKELSSISDRTKRDPALDGLAFPASPPSIATSHWTSTPCIGGTAWVIEFDVATQACRDRISPRATRLVRPSP